MIRVAFCCNDQRGNETGRVDAIDFSDSRGHEARLTGPALRFWLWVNSIATTNPLARVKVGRRFFDITPHSYKYGYGNWCWDAVTMSQAESKRLLAYLLERGFEAEDWTLTGPFAAIIQAHKRAA